MPNTFMIVVKKLHRLALTHVSGKPGVATVQISRHLVANRQHGGCLFLSGYPAQRVPSHQFIWPSRHPCTQWTLMPHDSCHVPTRRGTARHTHMAVKANLLTQADCCWYAEPDIPGNWQPPSAVAAAAAAAQSGMSTVTHNISAHLLRWFTLLFGFCCVRCVSGHSCVTAKRNSLFSF